MFAYEKIFGGESPATDYNNNILLLLHFSSVDHRRGSGKVIYNVICYENKLYTSLFPRRWLNGSSRSFEIKFVELKVGRVRDGRRMRCSVYSRSGRVYGGERAVGRGLINVKLESFVVVLAQFLSILFSF